MDNVKFAQKCILENNEGKILILQRSNYKNNESDYKWDLPGGTVEDGEDCREAIVRECKEEIGVNLNSFEPKIIYSRPIPNKYFFIFSLCFSKDYEYEGDNIRLSFEHVEYKWVDKKDFKNYEYIHSVSHIKNEIYELLNK